MMTGVEPSVPSGPELEQIRKGLKLSRQKLVDQLGSPWTEGRLNGYEKGKRNLRPAEKDTLLKWMQFSGGDALAAGVRQPTEQLEMHLPESDDEAIELLPPEEDPYAFQPLETLAHDNDLVDVMNRYAALYSRWTAANVFPPFAWPIAGTLEAATPDELDLVVTWMQNVEEWLNLLQQPGQVLEPTNPAVPVTVEATDSAPGLSLVQRAGAAGLYMTDGTRMLTNGEFQTFKHCRRRWWLAWYRGLRLKREVLTGAAPLGTRCHTALAGWYVPEGETPVDPRETLERTIQEDEARLLETSRDIDSADAARMFQEFTKEAEMARAMIEGYVEWLAETGNDSQYQVIAPEQVITAVVEVHDDLTIRLQGRLDVRMVREHDLVRLFMDHKTVGDFNTIPRLAPIDEQMKMYHLLEMDQDDEERPRTEGVIYNMLRKVKRTKTANPPFYDRHEQRHNERTIANFRGRLRGEAMVIEHTEKMLDKGTTHQLVAYPSPGRDCLWKCEFFALCSMLDDGSRAEDFIAEHYETVNPLDRYVEEKGTSL